MTKTTTILLLDQLVNAASRIAMFDRQWDDESEPEIKAIRDEFRTAFRGILFEHWMKGD